MTVQKGPLAVRASSGPVGGGLVDGGDLEAYLHSVAARLPDSRDFVRTNDSTSGRRRCYFVPPPMQQLHKEGRSSYAPA